MNNIALFPILSFVLGVFLSALIFKKKNNDTALYSMLNDFRRTIDELKNQNNIDTKEIKDAIKSARELTKILTTNQNLKGKFGEDCLEVILQACYPNQNINYFKQITSTNSDDKKIKPDYLVKLPNDKSVLIDCKLNLEKYIDYKENETQLSKNELIKDINQTINKLSSKHYESADKINQADFILMYIPLEPVITLIYTDKDFVSVIRNATEKNIIIVGNSSILTTIKLINLLWAQDRQERNIDNIVNIAQNIYNLIANHAYNLHQIKENLENNLASFNKEYEKMTSQTKLFNLLEELKNYGLAPLSKRKGKKFEEVKIPDEFLNN